MDVGGWYPGKKAAQQQVCLAVSSPFTSVLPLRLPSSPLVQEVDLPLFKGPDGQFRRFARIEPMEDASIGGWAMAAPEPSSASSPMNGSGNAGSGNRRRT